MNGGRVYAAYDYEAAMDDELSFKEGDELVVIKRDDGPQSPQKGWWCARDPKIEKEGFVPRNYLAVSSYAVSIMKSNWKSFLEININCIVIEIFQEYFSNFSVFYSKR